MEPVPCHCHPLLHYNPAVLNLWNMLLYLGIFLIVYISIWLSQYSVYRRKIQKINQKLQEDAK